MNAEVVLNRRSQLRQPVFTRLPPITYAAYMYKQDGVKLVWRKLWFEVRGTRLTFFQRDDETGDFNRSVSKRGQIKMEQVQAVRRSQHSEPGNFEIEIVCSPVRT